MKNDIRVKIDEVEQKDLFKKFLRKFKNNFDVASNYLGITQSSLSKYKRGVVRYIPKEVLIKIVDYLEIEAPKIIYSGTLKEIRYDYMMKAYPVLREKYGKNWAKELTNRRDFKGIRLSDFPDYAFVYLEDNYRKNLLNAFYNFFRFKNDAAKFLRVSSSRIGCWFEGKQWDRVRDKIGPEFIPLDKLKIISKELVDDSRDEFSIENIEKHTVMYRMQGGNPIRNPKFLIREGPELVRLLFHLIGDGYAGRLGDNANYKNISNELLNEFKEDLKIFGEVPVYEQKFSIKFPRIIADIIGNFYGIDFRTFESSISQKILQIPKKYLCCGIRAFADDEGTIYSNSVRLTSGNKNLLEGIKIILGYLKIRCGEIKQQNNPKARMGVTYYLDINDLEGYCSMVGFAHPRKKKLMETYVRRLKSRRRNRLLKS